jgi:hypothetical protein
MYTQGIHKVYTRSLPNPALERSVGSINPVEVLAFILIIVIFSDRANYFGN